MRQCKGITWLYTSIERLFIEDFGLVVFCCAIDFLRPCEELTLIWKMLYK